MPWGINSSVRTSKNPQAEAPVQREHTPLRTTGNPQLTANFRFVNGHQGRTLFKVSLRKGGTWQLDSRILREVFLTSSSKKYKCLCISSGSQHLVGSLQSSSPRYRLPKKLRNRSHGGAWT